MRTDCNERPYSFRPFRRNVPIYFSVFQCLLLADFIAEYGSEKIRIIMFELISKLFDLA